MRDLTLRGIIAATVTPMTDDLEVDVEALRAYMRWLLDEGVHGVAVNVDTGEGPQLDPAERLQVVEAVRGVVGDRIPVVSGLAPGWTPRVVEAARDLKAAGADALLVFPPSAFRGTPLPAELPVGYYRQVGEGADVPLVLFQLQDSLGGVEYPTDVLVAIAGLDHVVAIKEATFDALKFRDAVTALGQAAPDVSILTGNDNFIYESFVLGATGALIGFGTVATRLQVEMVEAHEAGDHARAAALAARFQPLVDVVFGPPIRDYRARLKAALEMQGVIPSSALRLPLQPAGEAERARLAAALEAVSAPGARPTR
jgi:4-hydroxy-tetrahydrodipicolinate synthase